MEFAKSLADLPRNQPRGQTAFHGPLPNLIKEIRTDMAAKPVGRYREHTVYEIDVTGAEQSRID
jgi:hypothetical protein